MIRAFGANAWYGFPSRKLKLIGVTGTDGKTTTTHLIYHILSFAGKKTSMISTIYAKIGRDTYDTGFHVTTPDAVLIPRFLKKALDMQQEYFILETTSHRLDQNQLTGVDFFIGVITNITHEHLDYHRTYDNYAKSKLMLLRKSHIAVVNRDDDSYTHIKKSRLPKSKLVTYGLMNRADFSRDFRKEFTDLADFNAYNYLAAYTVCRKIGVSEETIVSAFKTFELPSGRIEMVYNKEFKVIVDFAHTPNAIKNILQTIRPRYIKTRGKLIHVFGSAGLRDATKRSLMGQASATGADIVVLTEEDYRTENPDTICRQIADGLKSKGFKLTHKPVRSSEKTYSIIIERKEAIFEAIQIAQKGDVVIITGKGHEKSLCRGTVEYPWDDKKAVKEILSL